MRRCVRSGILPAGGQTVDKTRVEVQCTRFREDGREVAKAGGVSYRGKQAYTHRIGRDERGRQALAQGKGQVKQRVEPVTPAFGDKNHVRHWPALRQHRLIGLDAAGCVLRSELAAFTPRRVGSRRTPDEAVLPVDVQFQRVKPQHVICDDA